MITVSWVRGSRKAFSQWTSFNTGANFYTFYYFWLSCFTFITASCVYVVYLKSFASLKYRYRSLVWKPLAFEGGWPPGRPMKPWKGYGPDRWSTRKSQGLSNKGAIAIFLVRDTFKRDFACLLLLLWCHFLLSITYNYILLYVNYIAWPWTGGMYLQNLAYG